MATISNASAGRDLTPLTAANAARGRASISPRGVQLRESRASEKEAPTKRSIEFRFDAQEGVLRVEEGESGRTLYELRLRGASVERASTAGQVIDRIA